MTIRYVCNGCGSPLKIEDRLAGSEGRCPKCHAPFSVPQPDGSKRLAVAHADAVPITAAAFGSPVGSWESDEDLAASLLMDDAAPPPADGSAAHHEEHIRYTCTGCGSHLTIRSDRAGTQARCPQCRARFTAPMREEPGEGAAVAASGSTSGSGSPIPSEDNTGEAPALPDSPSGDEKPRRRAFVKSDETRIGTAAAASALLKQVHSHAETPTPEANDPPRAKPQDAKRWERVEAATYFVRTGAPALAGIAVACAAVYWLASAIMVGGPARPALGSVTGTVTLNSKPLAGALVTFRPKTNNVDGESAAESVGWTDESGRYSLIYVQDVEGAAIGDHDVRINAMDARGVEILPAEYHTRSTRTVTVQAGRNTFDFSLELKP